MKLDSFLLRLCVWSAATLLYQHTAQRVYLCRWRGLFGLGQVPQEGGPVQYSSGMSETNAELSASSDMAEGNSGDEKQEARWSPHTFQTRDEAARRIQRRSQERLLQRQALSELLPAATSKFSSVETLSAGMSNFTEAPNAAGFSSNDEVELPHAMAARYDAKVIDQEAVVAAEHAVLTKVISRPFSSHTLSSPAGSPLCPTNRRRQR